MDAHRSEFMGTALRSGAARGLLFRWPSDAVVKISDCRQSRNADCRRRIEIPRPHHERSAKGQSSRQLGRAKGRQRNKIWLATYCHNRRRTDAVCGARRRGDRALRTDGPTVMVGSGGALIKSK